MTKIELDGGKYTYVFDGGKQYVLRYGEQWRDLTGDKFIYLMAARIDELESAMKELSECYGSFNNVSSAEVLAGRVRAIAKRALS